MAKAFMQVQRMFGLVMASLIGVPVFKSLVRGESRKQNFMQVILAFASKHLSYGRMLPE